MDPTHREVNAIMTGTSPYHGAAGGGKGGGQHQQLDVSAIMEDPVTLMLMLNKHKESLNLTLREINALKAVIQGQEQAISKLQQEKATLLDQVRTAKETELELVQQIQHLSETCEQLTATIQRRGMENAARLNALESQKKEADVAAKAMIDRLHNQLLSTQNPISSARPMPWNRVQAIEGHPAHVLREVVLLDSRREESMMARPMTVQMEDDMLAKLKEHSRPPAIGTVSHQDEATGERNSDDEAIWRQVLARIHDVLLDRRKWLSTSNEPSPAEFLLRTRHQLVGEVVHIHQVVAKCSNLVSVLFDRLESVVSASGGQAIGGQLELVAATVADMDATLHRVKLHCFSTADCVYHNLATMGVGPTSFTQNRPMLPGGPSQRAGGGGALSGAESVLFGSSGSPRQRGDSVRRSVRQSRVDNVLDNSSFGSTGNRERRDTNRRKSVAFGDDVDTPQHNSPPASPTHGKTSSTSFASAASLSFAKPIDSGNPGSGKDSPSSLSGSLTGPPRQRAATTSYR